MPNSTYFCQECPTCGRLLQIRVEYLGKQVVCQHCRGKFVATDPATARYAGAHANHSLLQRADELLEGVALRKSHPPVAGPP
jgi:hypothetical protein